MITNSVTPAVVCPTHRKARAPFWSRINAFFALYKQRQALKSLDAERLNDIGVSRADACLEAERVFWDVPAHWKN